MRVLISELIHTVKLGCSLRIRETGRLLMWIPMQRTLGIIPEE
jgi:hypothetical protein